MNWWQSVVLGIIQGLAEFLPISSSGHLVFFRALLQLPPENLLLDTCLHMGTLIAVVVVLWKDIVEIFRHLFAKTTWLLIVATLPAVVVTLLFNDYLDEIFGGRFLGLSFLLTSVILLLVSVYGNKSTETGRPLNEISYFQALMMGIAQAIAILPGVSRSGFTLAGGLASGINRDSALRFSFLMSIAAAAGSFVLQTKDVLEMGWKQASAGMPIGPVILGTVMAALMGFFALKWMLSWVRQGKLWIFGVYMGLLGIYTILDQYLLHLLF